MRSASTKEIAAALAKAQTVLRHAPKDSINPHFQNSYSSLASVLDVIREPMAMNGLSITQSPQMSDKGPVLETTILHVSGEWISSETPLLFQKNDMQGLGGAISYARRYAAASMLGVASDDDDAESTKDRPTLSVAKAPAFSDDPGEYVFPFKKHKDQKLKDIDPYKLQDYAEWMDRNAMESGTPITGNALLLKNKIEDYLGKKRPPEPPLPTDIPWDDDPPPFDTPPFDSLPNVAPKGPKARK